MGNGVIGKIIYFWVFILGGLFVARVAGFANNDKQLIALLIGISIVYVVFMVARSLGKKKRRETEMMTEIKGGKPRNSVARQNGAQKPKKKKK